MSYLGAWSGSVDVAGYSKVSGYTNCYNRISCSFSVAQSSNTMNFTLTSYPDSNYANSRVVVYDGSSGQFVAKYDSGYKSYGTFPCANGASVSGSFEINSAQGFSIAIELYIASSSTLAATSYLNPSRTLYLWNDINVYNPSGIQDYKSAYFDLQYSDEASLRTNLTNEPEPQLYKPSGTLMTISNIRPYYDYYELNSVTGATNLGNGSYRNTITTDNHVISINMKYKSCQLTFDPNGGTLPNPGGNLYSSLNSSNFVTVTYNFNSYSYMGNDIPTRTHYTFLGWYDENDIQVYDETGTCVVCDYWNNNSLWIGTNDLTVYAKWQPDEYVITFDGNGGTTVVDSLEIVYETNQNSDVSQYIPVRPAYEFLGWYSLPTNGVQVYDANGLCTNDGTYWFNNACVYTDDYTLYAQWKPLNIAYYKLDGEWLLCNSYIKVNGIWHPAIYKRNFNGDYDFEIAVLLDEEGNILTDENGNILVIIE